MRCGGMKRRIVALLVALIGVASGWVFAAALTQQSSSDQGVTIRATPRDLAPTAKGWEFEMVLETHSRDLIDDLKSLVTLVADGGVRRVPTAWEGDPPGGHHRKGVLRFSPVTPWSQAIELVVSRPGETSPRTFRWQLQ